MKTSSTLAPFRNYSGSSSPGTARAKAINKISPVDESLSALYASVDKLQNYMRELEIRLTSVLAPDDPQANNITNSEAPINLRTKIDLAKRSVDSVIELQENILKRLEV